MEIDRLQGGSGQGGRANALCQDRCLGQMGQLGLEWGPIHPAVKMHLGVQREKVKAPREVGGGRVG